MLSECGGVRSQGWEEAAEHAPAPSSQLEPLHSHQFQQARKQLPERTPDLRPSSHRPPPAHHHQILQIQVRPLLQARSWPSWLRESACTLSARRTTPCTHPPHACMHIPHADLRTLEPCPPAPPRPPPMVMPPRRWQRCPRAWRPRPSCSRRSPRCPASPSCRCSRGQAAASG